MGKAATHPPALAILSHKPRGATKNIAWVGKGIVYDTGGLCLKSKVCYCIYLCVYVCKGVGGGEGAVCEEVHVCFTFFCYGDGREVNFFYLLLSLVGLVCLGGGGVLLLFVGGEGGCSVCCLLFIKFF